MLRYLPNAMTFLRLLLALPLGVLILRQEFGLALAVGLIAGVTDALDGFFARRFNSFSRFGAALDPIADKILIMVSFLTFASIGLVPWYLTIAVIARDLIIVAGATCYHFLIGPFEFAASRLSKLNMFVQISFCVLVLAAQVLPQIPPVAITAGVVAVLFIAASSGFDYIATWTARAISTRRGNGA